MNLMRNERPLLFFSLDRHVVPARRGRARHPDRARVQLDTGLVPRFPTAILCSALGVIAALCIATGLILDLVAHVRRESKRLAYLSYPAPRRAPRRPTS